MRRQLMSLVVAFGVTLAPLATIGGMAWPLGCSAGTVHSKAESAAGLGQSGFSIGCGPDARGHFVRGLRALHSFFYDEAKSEFQATTRVEPSCAIGYWGEALADGEQLWSWQDTDAGRATLAKAIALRAKLTPKEMAFVDAAAVLVGRDGDTSTAAARVRAYVEELRRMHVRWPDDDDVAAFWALGLLSAEDPPSLRDRMQAGATALEVLARNPRHPGALHYAIHAFDDPEHAVLALPAARTYAAVAPDAPHARHMPAHIFVELGHWADAAASCESAWQVSLAHVARLGQTRDHTDLHSLSWLGPIYAQLGQRARADQALETFAKIVETGGYTAIAFIGSALSVVRDSERWDRLEALLSPVAATLPAIESRYRQSRSADTLPMPAVVRALRAAAIATAASRLHDLDRAKQQRGELKAAREQAAELAPRYAARAAYQAAARADALRVDAESADALRVDAEIAAAEGNVAAAEDALRQAIPLEATVAESDGAYPGRVSSYERLGELALGAGRNREAADDFARALERTPGRSRALHLAALAAERLGESARAADLRWALARNWAHADADFPGVREIRARVSGN